MTISCISFIFEKQIVFRANRLIRVRNVKGQQRWLWHAINHHTGEILAYTLGDWKDAVFLELKTLLAPFEITRFYTDDWGAYERHLPPEQQVVGKINTQKIERKH